MSTGQMAKTFPLTTVVVMVTVLDVSRGLLRATQAPWGSPLRR